MQKARRHILICSDRLQAYGFRIYFTPFLRVLFTFPSRYQFTIGLSVVFSLSGWSRQIHTGLLVSRATQDTTINNFYYLYGTFTLFGLSFQTVPVLLASNIVVLQPQNCRNNSGLGYCTFARRYLRNHFCFLLLRVLRCFSSPGLPPALSGISRLHRDGLPHSDIYGSIRMCRSPQLFAAYHVLLRL